MKQEWKEGIRSNHSKKLKESWKNRDKEKQSKILTKTLTKWVYYLEEDKPLYYKDLVELGLKNCITTFCIKKCNKIKFKNFIITRVKIEQSKDL